jgi:outer membrane lipoprotein-sorting protein
MVTSLNVLKTAYVRMAFIMVALISLITLTAGVSHATPLPARLAERKLAILTNDGSTNTLGWTLTVNTDGSGSLIYNYTSTQYDKTFPADTFNTRPLKRALTSTPLNPSYGCVRSNSFGAEEDLTYGQTTTYGIDCYMLYNPKTPLSVQLNNAIDTAGAENSIVRNPLF